MTEILFAAYFALSCANLGELYKVSTEYRVGRGCYVKATGEFLPRPPDCWNCSVAVSYEAHARVRQAAAHAEREREEGGKTNE